MLREDTCVRVHPGGVEKGSYLSREGTTSGDHSYPGSQPCVHDVFTMHNTQTIVFVSSGELETD